MCRSSRRGFPSVPVAIQPRGWRFGSSGPDDTMFSHTAPSTTRRAGHARPTKVQVFVKDTATTPSPSTTSSRCRSESRAAPARTSSTAAEAPTSSGAAASLDPICDKRLSTASTAEAETTSPARGQRGASTTWPARPGTTCSTVGSATRQPLRRRRQGLRRLLQPDGSDRRFARRTANDGQAGENDFIHDDVEGVQGGSGKDTLYGGFLQELHPQGWPE